MIKEPLTYRDNPDFFHQAFDNDQYYKTRLRNPDLFFQAVHHRGEFLIPADNDTRHAGTSQGYKTADEAHHVYNKLAGRKGFHNLRVQKHHNVMKDGSPMYSLAWGAKYPNPDANGNHEMIYRKQGELFGYKPEEVNRFLSKPKPTGMATVHTTEYIPEKQPGNIKNETN